MISKRAIDCFSMAAFILCMTSRVIFTVAADKAAASFEDQPILETECNPPPPLDAPAPPTAASWAHLRSDVIHEKDCPEITGCSTSCSFPAGFRKMQDSTYINLRCFHNRSQTLTAVSQVLRNHPDRAITLMLAVNDFRMDSLHPDVLQPLQRNLLDLEVLYVASDATERLYKTGTLSNLVGITFSMGLDLIIGRRDFSRLPQIRQIIFDQLTIASIEPYTFTDLPLLGALQLETGLDYMLRRELRLNIYGATKYGQSPQREKILEQLFERHCRCNYTWLRNMYRRRPELLSRRSDGELAVIGNYYPRDHRLPLDQGILLVDCGPGYNASTFFEKGTGGALDHLPAHWFSVNTTCHVPPCLICKNDSTS
ncbi:uncharacterized protein LOC129590961 [Paramacrobiotus metropolitanus]|uniref:uncharacterized protein LOC129590961 n=1 Tax=Paramacrobiotus metropolitanus TaxID=2943436 RepID=UPI00244600E8|nr:uncharacterized protein LOC129590961 [Paramacrobiotus metropolitanus]